MKTGMVSMALLMAVIAVIVPQMTVAAPVARQYTLVQVPVIELDRIDGPSSPDVAARIRAAVAKSGKAVVAISGNQFTDVSATQDRVSGRRYDEPSRYTASTQKWAKPGQMIAPTNHFSVTGETGYYEEDNGRQIAGAVVSAVVGSALEGRSSGRRGSGAYASRDGFRGYVGGTDSSIDWRKKSVYVDLTLEAPSTATGLYDEFGSVHARGTASLEDLGININANNFGRHGATAYASRDGGGGSISSGNEAKLFQKAADKALQQLVAGLPQPQAIGPITVQSGKSLVAGKSKIVFFRDNTKIASYQVLAVNVNKISVWPLYEVSRPTQGDSFDIVQ